MQRGHDLIPGPVTISSSFRYTAAPRPRKRGTTHLFVGLCLLALPACTPYPFSKEGADFGTGVTQVAEAYRTGNASWDSDRALLLHRVRVDQRARLRVVGDCLGLRAPGVSAGPCELAAPPPAAPAQLAAWRQAREDHLNELRQEASFRDRTETQMAALTAYAQGLKAITNADDRAKYDAAAKRVGAAVGSVASAADLAAPGASTVAPAITNILLWGVGLALDYDRYQSLSQATKMAQDPVRAIGLTIGQGLERTRGLRLQVMRDIARQLNDGLGPNLATDAYDRRLIATEEAVGRIRSLTAANPAEMATKLVAAHDALVKAVDDPDRQLSALITAIEEFTRQADAVRTAFASLHK